MTPEEGADTKNIKSMPDFNVRTQIKTNYESKSLFRNNIPKSRFIGVDMSSKEETPYRRTG